jgi:hypothetical protein
MDFTAFFFLLHLAHNNHIYNTYNFYDSITSRLLQHIISHYINSALCYARRISSVIISYSKPCKSNFSTTITLPYHWSSFNRCLLGFKTTRINISVPELRFQTGNHVLPYYIRRRGHLTSCAHAHTIFLLYTHQTY